MAIAKHEKSGMFTDKDIPAFGYYRSMKEAEDAQAQRAGKQVPKTTPEESAEANKADEQPDAEQ